MSPHLAAVAAELACGPAPAVTAPFNGPAMPWTAQRHRIPFYHLSQRRDAGRQAEPLEARGDIVPGRFKARRNSPRRCAICLYGVAFLRGFDTPSLRAHGGNADLAISTGYGTFPKCTALTVACSAYESHQIVWTLLDRLDFGRPYDRTRACAGILTRRHSPIRRTLISAPFFAPASSSMSQHGHPICCF